MHNKFILFTFAVRTVQTIDFMRKILLFLVTLLTMTASAQTYDAMWKEVEDLGNKDLPQSLIELLQNLIAKAEKQKLYGNLMKAELMVMQLQASISSDSLAPAIKRLAEKEKTISDKALDAVYCAALYRSLNAAESVLEEPDYENLGLDADYYKQRAMENPAVLMKARCADYQPFTSLGTAAKYFNSDLLSVIGFELGDYRTMNACYDFSGNREAAFLTALEIAREEHESSYSYERINYEGSQYKNILDSIEKKYGDLPLCGKLAIERLNYMDACEGVTLEDKIKLIDDAMTRWSGYEQINELKNERRERTNPRFTLSLTEPVLVPGKPVKVELTMLRNINKLTVTVSRTKLTGEDMKKYMTVAEYEKLKRQLISTDFTATKEFYGHEEYEYFKDSIVIGALKPGVYLAEFEAPGIPKKYTLLNVTGIFVAQLSLPEEKTRVAVLNSVTGQPIPGANIKLSYGYGNRPTTKLITADKHGEAIINKEEKNLSKIYAYTDADKFATPITASDSYYYKGDKPRVTTTNVYTDRAIYRPGQTVKVSTITFAREADNTEVVAGKTFKVQLKDANWQIIDTKSVTSDEFGTATAEFVLPKDALNGEFMISADGTSTDVRVEEYKRPTFEITFPELTQKYKANDVVAIEPQVKTFAGAPVQGAKVEYVVTRREARWWWFANGNDEVLKRDTAVTDGDGKFVADVKLELPEGAKTYFYNYELSVKATSTNGETHEGSFNIPLGYKEAVLSCSLPSKAEQKELKSISFNLLNAAGQDIDGEVTYWFDNGVTSKCQARQKVELMPRLTVGKHTLTAICEGDTLKKDIVIFSENDTKPCVETDFWTWQSHDTFQNDKPVIVQVGSSAPDVHMLYELLANGKVIEQGSVEENCSLLNRKFKYKEEYGDGLFMLFFWVKDGKAYQYTTSITKPLPDKTLNLTWETFRDRLTPGQQEEWKLKVSRNDGKVDAIQVLAGMYDKSLDQLTYSPHSWSLNLRIQRILPNTYWNFIAPRSNSLSASAQYASLRVSDLTWSSFDGNLFDYYVRRSRLLKMTGSVRVSEVVSLASAPDMEENKVYDVVEQMPVFTAPVIKEDAEVEAPKATENVQVRENLNETAFFYPQLSTDDKGVATISFTLPECLTTWRFMGLAHTKDMHFGQINSEIVAKKDLMVQPNVPRFVRMGDKASVASTIINMSEAALSGTTRMELVNPETEKVVYSKQANYEVAEGKTTSVVFDIDTDDPSLANSDVPLLICRVFATGNGFSDGEQHYLPLLPSKEMVTNTVAITQHAAGNTTVDLTKLIGKNASNAKITLEYTNNPAWMIVQALPSIDTPTDDDVISYLRAYYSNFLAGHFLGSNPQLKSTIKAWSNESKETLTSKLAKNEELKNIALNETPWVYDSNTETEWMQRLVNYYDENSLNSKINENLKKIKELQLPDGSWTWFKGMMGSYYMTLSVVEHLVRLNMMTGKNENEDLIYKGMKWMAGETNKMVAEMKKEEKKGHKQSFPGGITLQYLYTCAISDVELNSETKKANDYLIALLKKEVKNRTIFEKGLTAIILQHHGEESLAKEYVKSLKEWSVFSEELGRYYDTPRAGYTWRDYKIPTEVSAIEAISKITPSDRQTVEEMQRWLLQEKRTQFWATPLNSMDAIYAFMIGNTTSLDPKEPSRISLDGKQVEFSNKSAGLGYVKTAMPYNNEKAVEFNKTSDGTSWGAVYAQFMQPVKDVEATATGISVERTLDKTEGLKVGDKVKVKIVIRADRDYDFVQIEDKRAACMEPVEQLSGQHWGYYISPKDCSTRYFVLMLTKGTHTLETEYYIDRTGTYQYAPVTVQCSYSPEFNARSKGDVIEIK